MALVVLVALAAEETVVVLLLAPLDLQAELDQLVALHLVLMLLLI